jgi:hypothetical protein
MTGLRTRRISTAVVAVTMALTLAACYQPRPRSSTPPRAGAKEPKIESITPTSGPTSGGTIVTIVGDGFTDTTDVSFDGVAASFVVDDESQITATTPAHVQGSAPVAVTTSSGSSDDPIVFTYDPSADLSAEVGEIASEPGGANGVTLSITMRAHNNGPDTISDGLVAFMVEQEGAAAAGVDTNVPTAVNATGANCVAVGTAYSEGSWGWSCEHATLPPGSYFEMTFRVTYDTEPDLVGFSTSISDSAIADADTSNNYGSAYWPAAS